MACRLAAVVDKELEMMHFFRKLGKNEKGATAIEYGLIAALIAVAIISSVTVVGSKLTGTFTNVSNGLATS